MLSGVQKWLKIMSAHMQSLFPQKMPKEMAEFKDKLSNM